jgi:hypothetical protein
VKAEQQDALEAAALEWAKSGYPGSGAVFNHLALTVENIWPVEPHCSICKRVLNVPGDPASIDCGGDCAACMAEEEGEPAWVLRTWADVVTGDEVRMPGTDATATIAMRYRHPSEDKAGKSWHVVASAETGPWAYKTDHFVQPGECVVMLGTDTNVGPRFMNPVAPVEIKLTAEEVKLYGRLGWSNRVKVTT